MKTLEAVARNWAICVSGRRSPSARTAPAAVVEVVRVRDVDAVDVLLAVHLVVHDRDLAEGGVVAQVVDHLRPDDRGVVAREVRVTAVVARV